MNAIVLYMTGVHSIFIDDDDKFLHSEYVTRLSRFFLSKQLHFMWLYRLYIYTFISP